MVVGATGLCDTILESIWQAKQPWLSRFLILGLYPDLWVMMGDSKGGIFWELGIFSYNMASDIKF